MLLDQPTVHEYAVLLLPTSSKTSGALVFDRDIVSFFVSNSESIDLQEIKIDMGRQPIRASRHYLVAVDFDCHSPEARITVELDSGILGVPNVEGELHVHPPFDIAPDIGLSTDVCMTSAMAPLLPSRR
jgi:hypothetical protein